MKDAIDSHMQAGTYTIGIVIDPLITIRRSVLIKQIHSFILSKMRVTHSVDVAIPLRNSYERSIARSIIANKQQFPNLKLTLLLAEYQWKNHIKAQCNLSSAKYSDILTSANRLIILRTMFSSAFVRKLLDELSSNSDLIIYHLNSDRHISVLRSFIKCRMHHTFSIFDIL